MKSSTVVNLHRHAFLSKLQNARAKLDEGCDGTVAFCEAIKLWARNPYLYEELTPALIDELLGTALHPNATGGSANILRSNLIEHLSPTDPYATRSTERFFKDRSLEAEALQPADLCKLQSYYAVHFLTYNADLFPDRFAETHVGKLLTYAHLAETNQVCAVGGENVYDCLQMLAAYNPEIFNNFHRATIMAKRRLDLRPVTEQADATRYWTILNALDEPDCRPFRKPPFVRPSPTALYPYRVPSNDALTL